ncbi:MAG: GNAT family N-acetyltransferase [bacterium]
MNINSLLKPYPKKVRIKDGKEVILRPMEKGDARVLIRFFQRIDENDRIYLRHDVTKKEVIEEWCNNINYERVLPIMALNGGEVIGNSSLHRHGRHNWQEHVGQMRMVVSKEYRRRGLGIILAKEIFFLAFHTQLEILVADMASEQETAIHFFTSLGFRQEAVLKNHIKDINDCKQDLMILTQSVDALWEKYLRST